MTKLADGKINGNGARTGNDNEAFIKSEQASTLTRSFTYGKGLTAMVFGKRVLLFSSEYLIGKHGAGTSSAGSKLGEVDSEDKLVKMLGRYVDDMTLSSCKGVLRLGNISSGYVTGTDSLVEILALTKDGKSVPTGTPLEQGVEYTTQARDADGAEFDAVLKYEITRPASPDGKFPATVQPVIHTENDPPKTDKVNLVIGKVDLSDEKAAWLEPAVLVEKLGNPDSYEGIYVVITIFPGTYSPPANEPASSKVDEVLGVIGNDYWKTHALMKK